MDSKLIKESGKYVHNIAGHPRAAHDQEMKRPYPQKEQSKPGGSGTFTEGEGNMKSPFERKNRNHRERRPGGRGKILAEGRGGRRISHRPTVEVTKTWKKSRFGGRRKFCQLEVTPVTRLSLCENMDRYINRRGSILGGLGQPLGGSAGFGITKTGRAAEIDQKEHKEGGRNRAVDRLWYDSSEEGQRRRVGRSREIHD